ncbi:MAG: hypothetical protein JWR15_749 [Prosthecobacter sp.]|nr:hypothetical protein [Prosthecobacter sp.]
MMPRLASLFVALLFLPKVSPAQPSLRDSLRVRPVPGLAFDAYVESVLRQGSMASVLAELSALIRDEKGRPGDALLLTMLLDASGHQADALVVLRQNAQRHPADRVSLSALAQSCAENGLGVEQEAALTQLYQLPAPPHKRLECLRQLAMVRQTHGRLRELRDAMVKHRTKQPEDPFGWLELAVVQARAGEDAESRRCVYEASRLRPKDVLLLGEIARREAGYGFISEALGTLDAADVVAKSSSTELLRCLIQLEGVGQAGARAALAAFKLPADADLELVLAVADKLAQGAAWGDAVRLLDQAMVMHATNYQIHYLRAVALEEMGDRDAAVTGFMTMLALAAELPADESLPFGRRYRVLSDTGRSLEGLSLPSGSQGLMHSQSAWQSAFNYRLGGSGICICYSYTQVEDSPPGPFIALPQSLLGARHSAVAHLRRLLPSVAAGLRAQAEKALVAVGLEAPEILLDAAGIKSNAALSRHPGNLAMHAARLISAEYGDSDPLEVLDVDVELFREAFPQLAFLAACRASLAAAAREAGVPAPAAHPRSAAAWRVVALNLIEQVPACPQVIDALLSLLPHRYGPRFGHAVDAPTVEELRILARAVDLALQLPEIRQESRGRTVATIVRAAIDNDDLPDAIRLVRAMANTAAPTAMPPPALTLSEPVGAPLPRPLADLGITSPVLAEVAAHAGGRGAARMLTEPGLSKARALLARVTEVNVRRVLELCLGDLAGIQAEIQERLASPKPALADHLLAVWLAQMQEDTTGVIQHLAAASALTRDAAQIRSIDQAALSAVGRYQEKLSEPDKAFVLAAIRRLQAVELHPAFTEASAQALRSIGTVAEVEQASQRENQERQARYAKTETMPYSSAAAAKQRQAREEETTRRLAAALKVRDLPSIAALGRVWLAPRLRENTFSFSMQQMLGQLGGKEAFRLLMQTCRPEAASGEAEQLRYASSLIEIGEDAAALQIYTELAERDENAYLPRLHAAYLLSEEAPDNALAQLRSIRLPSVLTAENGGSPVARLAMQRETAGHRASVARLITHWLNSTPDPAALKPLLDHQACINLIHMIQQGGREEALRFPNLNEARDHDGFVIPKGAGNEAMQRARQAHDDLCRTLLRLPEAQPVALAALASLVMRDGGDLSECARFATAMLRDPQAWLPLREWLSAPGAMGELFAGHGYIAVPSPMTILVRHAAQTKDFATFETESLPLIEKALGSSAAVSTRLYARLFSVPEPEYAAAATAWMATRTRDENPNVRSFDEVLNVWQARALRADLTELLLKSAAARSQLDLGNVPETLTRYVAGLIIAGRRDEAITFVKALRDQMISSDAAERRRLITAWQVQQTRYRSDDRELSRRPARASPEKPSHVYSFASWLKYAMRDPTLVCLLPLGFEEGLLGAPNELSQVAHEMVKPEILHSPAAAISLAENLGFLADAHGWQNYVLSPYGDPSTWISSLAYRLRDTQDTHQMRQMLAARKPQTLGSEIFAALLAHSRRNLIELGKRTSVDNRDELLHEVLARRQAELAAIPRAQRRVFSLLLRAELSGYPDLSKFDPGLAVALQPFLDAEADDLVPELDRILAIKEWAEVGMRPRDFSDRFPEVLAQAARRHPAKVEEVVRHACELLRKTPEDEQQRLRGWSRDTPIARFIWYLGQVPQLLRTCMSLAESEKLSLDPSWTESFTGKLTDYQLMRNRDHLTAIFTHTPLVADVEHFNDFVVISRGAYEGATLLDRIVNALNYDDETAQWLQQRLRTAPEQTFGIQLTLALLDSAAPIRKTKGNSNTARHDPAPLIAFAAAHSKDLSQLPPATAKAVQTLLDHYLKPPPDTPAQKNSSNGDPFGVPPSLR